MYICTVVDETHKQLLEYLHASIYLSTLTHTHTNTHMYIYICTVVGETHNQLLEYLHASLRQVSRNKIGIQSARHIIIHKCHIIIHICLEYLHASLRQVSRVEKGVFFFKERRWREGKRAGGKDTKTDEERERKKVVEGGERKR